MSIAELVTYLEENRQQVIDISTSIFDVELPEPILFTDARSVLDQFREQFVNYTGLPISRAFGSYFELIGVLLVNTDRIKQNQMNLRRSYKISLNPRWETLRVFSKEWGGYVHSYLHDSELIQQVLTLTKEFRSSDPPNILLPQAIMEAVGYAAKLKVAQRLGHRDEYIKAHHHYLSNAENGIEKSKDAAKKEQFGVMLTGYSLGEYLYRASDSYLKDFARLELRGACEVVNNEVPITNIPI